MRSRDQDHTTPRAEDPGDDTHAEAGAAGGVPAGEGPGEENDVRGAPRATAGGGDAAVHRAGADHAAPGDRAGAEDQAGVDDRAGADDQGAAGDQGVAGDHAGAGERPTAGGPPDGGGPPAGGSGMTAGPGPSGPEGSPRRLYRSREDRMIAGVCGGLADYFGIDPAIVRVAAVVLVFAGGAGLLAYLAAWLLVPDQGTPQIGRAHV
jgi:phage shock protein PspC (stress-responsive transcriptional regulator)